MTETRLLHGDCLEVLRTLEAESVDACVTDPPYELGFMNKHWDSTGIAFQPQTWREVMRVLKPGAHLLAFGGTRTFHRLACAIEDAGFEVRESLAWLHGQGFPKSLDIGKAFDDAAGVEREVVGRSHHSRYKYSRTTPVFSTERRGYDDGTTAGAGDAGDITAPATDLAKKWHGWGTALKPAFEPVIMARKPFSGSVKGNVEKHGTGALNIDKCRIGTVGGGGNGLGSHFGSLGNTVRGHKHSDSEEDQLGRWPANCVLSHHPDCGVLPTWEREPSPCDSSAADAVSGQKLATSATRGSIVPSSVALTPNERAKPRQPATDRTDIGCSDGLFPVEPSGSQTADSSLNTSASGNRPTAPSLTDSSSITETATDSITGSTICNSLPDGNTAPSTRRSAPTANASVGRWHCVPECPVRVLDEMTEGVIHSAGHARDKMVTTDYNATSYNMSGTVNMRRLGDDGGGSRFFYCAKPSREERDMGCWDLPPLSGGQATGRTDDSAGVNSPRAGAGRTGGGRNGHPTVKPIELMRWLVRLVTPPDGTVIDPFLGSGTTGMAARYELRNFIGIEREAEYLEIARRRIAAVSPLFASEPDVQPAAAPEARTLDLFSERSA